MRASLPMYDLAAVRRATDAWWRGLAGHLRAAGVADVPARLARDPVPAWDEPDLLLSQICGYPLIHRLAGHVGVVCTPCYAAPGCRGPRYSSVLLVSADTESLEAARGGTCAINARDSHSGCNVLRRMLAPLAGGRPFFTRVIVTGTHEASVAAVASGAADLCAVDAVTHALLQRHAPDTLEGTRALGFSPTAPGLPYIAGPRVGAEGVARMSAAIDAAFADPALAAVRAELLLDHAETVAPESYAEIVRMEHEAATLGYPELA